MGERYWVTGVQLGMLKETRDTEDREDLVDDIIDKQFIGNYKSEKDKKIFMKEIKKLGDDL